MLLTFCTESSDRCNKILIRASRVRGPTPTQNRGTSDNPTSRTEVWTSDPSEGTLSRLTRVVDLLHVKEPYIP
jgi:hypothetical protein